MPLHLLVAGGGIGGLAASLACARAGARVHVHERAPVFSEVGAGIQLGPNATRVLADWGLARRVLERAAAPECIRIFDARTGEELAWMPLGAAVEARYRAPYLTIHRADLQALLLAAAAESDVFLSTHSLLKPIEAGDGVVAQSSTQGIQHGDALVAADGVWSAVREAVLRDGAAQPTGHVAFRAICPQADVPERARSGEIQVWLGPRMHVVTYPVRGGEWLNVVALVEAAARPQAQDWDQLGTFHELRGALGPVASLLHARLEAMPHWRVWTLHARAPVAGPGEMAHGRIAFLGDAAHPMLPYLAQGAGMAIEDAHALAASFAAVPDVTKAIDSYARGRWERCARVQRRALRNARIFHAQGPLRWGRDTALRWLGPRLLDQPWLYGG